MEFKKKFKFSIRKLTVGVVSLSLGATVLAQPVSLLVQNNVAHAEEATPAAEPKAGKVTIERVDLETRPEIKANEEFKIKLKWVVDLAQKHLGGLGSVMEFDINTMEFVGVQTLTEDNVGTTYINKKQVEKGSAIVGITPGTNKVLEAVFTFRAKRDITGDNNYKFVFKADKVEDEPGKIQWSTNPDYDGPFPLASSWEGLDKDGAISVDIAKKEQDQPKPDQPKPDQPKPDQPKPDQPKPDQPKPDQPKPDQQKPDQQKPGQQKPGQQKPGQQKPGQPKPDQPGKGKLPNTGQTTTNAGIAGVALAGLALAATRRRKNK